MKFLTTEIFPNLQEGLDKGGGLNNVEYGNKNNSSL